MHVRSILAAAVVVVSSSAFAQITIDYTDVQNYYNTGITVETQTGTPAAINIGTPGAAQQQFDFSGITFGTATTQSYVDPATTKFAADFPNASFAYQSNESGSIAYSYVRLSPNGILLMGVENDSFRMRFMPPMRSLALPLTLDATWSSEARGDSISYGTFKVPTRYSLQGTCDAYGMLVTSRGAWPCLRVKQVMTMFATMGTMQMQVSKTMTYSYHAKNGESVSITIDTLKENQANQTPLSISYSHLPGPMSVEDAAPTALSLLNAYPNPAREQSMLEYTIAEKSAVSAELVNMLGARVATLATGMQEAGTHFAAVDVASLPAGSYMYRVTVNGRVHSNPIVIVK